MQLISSNGGVHAANTVLYSVEIEGIFDLVLPNQILATAVGLRSVNKL